MNFLAELWTSFKEMKGVPAAIAGIVLSWLGFIYTKSDTVPVPYVITGSLIVFFAFLTLFNLAFRMFTVAQRKLPKVKRIVLNNDSIPILLLEPSSLFAFGSLASVFWMKEDVEVLIGVGHIHTIQENRFIQVLVSERIPAYSGEWDRLSQNDLTLISKLLVKPTVPREYQS